MHEGIGENKEIMRHFFVSINKQTEELRVMKVELEEEGAKYKVDFFKCHKQLSAVVGGIEKEVFGNKSVNIHSEVFKKKFNDF